MTRQEIEELIYGRPEQQRRFTQDFPILPDVWIAFAEKPNRRIELLLTPYSPTTAATLSRALRDRSEQEQEALERYRAIHSPDDRKLSRRPRVLFNESVVFANFTFEELIRVAMPLTDWWKDNMADLTTDRWDKKDIAVFIRLIRERRGAEGLRGGDPRLLRKLITIIGTIECDRYQQRYSTSDASEEQVDQPQMDAFTKLLNGLTNPQEHRGLLYNISLNRLATTSIWRSRMAVKADAAARVFDVDTSGIRWAVLDVGIDAKHKAFARRERGKSGNADNIVKETIDENGKRQFASRVVRTYDFLRVKDLLDPDTPIVAEGSYAETLEKAELKSLTKDLKYILDSGRALDWDLIEPFLRIPHVDGFYDDYQKLVTDSHGTHVAGIIAANWPEASDETSLKRPLCGICPDLELFDLRVLGKDKYGDDADEFTVIAALQFIRHLNAHRELMTVHGVNLSMAVTHDVANYACGRTPICEECERVVANGVVVVTAAGNRGFTKLVSPESGAMGDYRSISITDPGNAENVITVGATHRFMPHNYGVSYFSSRGPTGDGRIKPDLVAPGEKIDSCAPGNDFETMDGTSMAAPHVSGAAALLIARHRELIGQTKRVKEILCKSATDLGREPRFQGAGMLDVLRALQSV
jgi:serine protease AprX